MKYFYILFLSLIVALTASCCKKENVSVKSNEKQWERLIIESYKQRIILDNSDSGIRYTWDIEEKHLNNGSTEKHAVNFNAEKFQISKAELDSVFIYANNIVSNPVIFSEYDSCNNHFGIFSVSLSSGITTVSCSYSYCEKWSEISPQINALFLLLKNKINININ